jgi:hypothetical protein
LRWGRLRWYPTISPPAGWSRSYCTYVPDAKSEDELVVLFRSWLEREGMRSPDGNKAR